MSFRGAMVASGGALLIAAAIVGTRSHETTARPRAELLQSQKVPVPPDEAPAPARLRWPKVAELLRSGQFSALIAGKDQLPSDPRAQLVLAEAALALGKPEEALAALDRLRSESSLFEREADQLEYEAVQLTCETSRLQRTFDRAPTPAIRIRLADCRLAAGDAEGAWKLLTSAAPPRSPSSPETIAWQDVLSRTAQKLGKADAEARALRFLAIEAPLDPKSERAPARLEQLGPDRRLTRSDHSERARRLADEGRIQQVALELERAKKLPGTPPNETFEAYRAFALYNSRTDYRAAAELFNKLAQQSPGRAAEFLYYSAKSQARAHDNEQALKTYQLLTQRFARTEFGEHAAYQLAHLRLIMGEFEKAAQLFRSYLADKSRKRHRDEATWELAWAEEAFRQKAPGQTLKQLERMTQAGPLLTLVRERQAAALLRDGQKQAAIERLRDIATREPLTLGATFAFTRLRVLGQAAPGPIGAASAPSQPFQALDPALPAGLPLLVESGLDRLAERSLAAHESTLRRLYGSRSGEALCEAHGTIDRAARRYQVAQFAVSASALNQRPGPQDLWMWRCIYPEPHGDAVNLAAAESNVPRELIYAVMRQESAFRPEVRSPADAIGLMQLIESTAQRVAAERSEPYAKEKLKDPATNIRWGAHYLRTLLDYFEQNPILAVAAYNAGPQAVTRWLQNWNSPEADVFVGLIPYEETRTYVVRVLGNYARYSYLNGGKVPEISLELPKDARAPADAY